MTNTREFLRNELGMSDEGVAEAERLQDMAKRLVKTLSDAGYNFRDGVVALCGGVELLRRANDSAQMHAFVACTLEKWLAGLKAEGGDWAAVVAEARAEARAEEAKKDMVIVELEKEVVRLNSLLRARA